jgi:hypothetical protein
MVSVAFMLEQVSEGERSKRNEDCGVGDVSHGLVIHF